MKKGMLFLIMFLSTAMSIQGQKKSMDITLGDTLVLGKPISSEYRYVHFPAKNTIIKRGAIANFKSVINKKVIVEQMYIDANGITQVVLKRSDGRKFFRFFPRVTANLKMALEKEELTVLNG
ncbi:MAG: hypothetical protein AAFZ89_09370 [Bacteroidota bacterium]